MKKFLSVCLGTVMLLALAGCGQKMDYLKYFEDIGYTKVDSVDVNPGETVEGVYSYVDDRQTLDDMTITSVDVTGLEGKDLNSILTVVRTKTYDGEYEDQYSYGTASAASGYSVLVLDYKDEEKLEEVFKSIESQTAVTLNLVRMVSKEDHYDYASDDDYFSVAYQMGSVYVHSEYFIDDGKLVIAGGIFVCKNDAYRDYLEFYDYMDRDCNLTELKFEPVAEEDFDIDLYLINPENPSVRVAAEVYIQ